MEAFCICVFASRALLDPRDLSDSSRRDFHLPVLFPRVGDGVLEQHGIQPHLGRLEGHVSEELGEGIDATLLLVEVTWVRPERPENVNRLRMS